MVISRLIVDLDFHRNVCISWLEDGLYPNSSSLSTVAGAVCVRENVSTCMYVLSKVGQPCDVRHKPELLSQRWFLNLCVYSGVKYSVF